MLFMEVKPTLSIIKLVMWLSELLLLVGCTSLSGNSNILDWGSRELSPVQKGEPSLLAELAPSGVFECLELTPSESGCSETAAGLWLVEAWSRDLDTGL